MGDIEGLAEFYNARCSELVGVVSLVCGDRAEAQVVVQEAFARLIPRWASVRHHDDPQAWVRKVAFRLLSNRFRQRRRTVLSRIGESRLSRARAALAALLAEGEPDYV